MTWWQPGRDAAASEVVGYVLITGISVLAITIVVLTGGPALEEIQSSQQHDSMIRYFHDLDQGFSLLLSGAPAGSTPIWSVSQAQGSISLEEGGEHVWVYAADRLTDRGFWYRGVHDEDNTFTIENYGPTSVGSLDVEASTWDGATETEISASVSGGSGTWTITLTNAGTDVNLHEHTTEILFRDTSLGANSAPISRAWIIGAGAVEWQRSGQDFQRILYQNTGIIALIDNGQVMHNGPRIQPPDTTGNNREHLFIRIARIDGGFSIGGRTSANILLSSDGNHVRHAASNVERVQIYPPTVTKTAWNRFLENDNAGYTYTWDSNPTGSSAEPVAFRDKSDNGLNELSVTMVETNVQMSMRGGV